MPAACALAINIPWLFTTGAVPNFVSIASFVIIVAISILIIAVVSVADAFFITTSLQSSPSL
eukprot:9501787-Pyramimonas_sp.AAC.1